VSTWKDNALIIVKLQIVGGRRGASPEKGKTGDIEGGCLLWVHDCPLACSQLWGKGRSDVKSLQDPRMEVGGFCDSSSRTSELIQAKKFPSAKIQGGLSRRRRFRMQGGGSQTRRRQTSIGEAEQSTMQPNRNGGIIATYGRGHGSAPLNNPRR